MQNYNSISASSGKTNFLLPPTLWVFAPFAITLLFFPVCVSAAISEPSAHDWEGGTLSFTWENDAVTGKDRHYTQGARISYWSPDNHLPRWLASLSRFLPALGMDVEAQRWGLAASQEIYTPDDLITPTLIADDRPYAGWLYASFGLQRHGPSSFSLPAIEVLRLDLGVVGPESLAEETQKAWHDDPPKGWDHQLRTEIGAILNYDRRYLLTMRQQNSRWGADFIPHFGAGAGNVSTYLTAGPLFRFGYNMPNEFIARHSEPTSSKIGAYLYMGLDGRLVLHNIFLDGNTFVDSHSVEKNLFVGDFKVGLTLVFKKMDLTAGQAFVTDEFESQKKLGFIQHSHCHIQILGRSRIFLGRAASDAMLL